MPELQFKAQNRQRGKMEIRNQTETKVQLNIYGDIVSDEWGKWSDDDTCPTDISNFLKDLDGVSEIEMHINSGGGSVFAGWDSSEYRICDCLRRRPDHHSEKRDVYDS